MKIIEHGKNHFTVKQELKKGNAKSLLKQSIEKWELIGWLIGSLPKRLSCPLCVGLHNGWIKKCPLNAKCSIFSGCCTEWENIHKAVNLMIKKLKQKMNPMLIKR